MADSGRILAWKRQLEKNIFTPLAWDRQREGAGDSAPFVISLKAADGIVPKSDGKGGQDYRLQVSLFDITYKQFFGRTWVSTLTQGKGTAQKTRINFNQNVYFHTALNDIAIAAVVELVSVGHVGDGKMQQVSCGWGILRPFKVDGDMTDLSAAAPPVQKLDLYQGSPRALLYLDEPIEGNPMLQSITGSQVMYTVQTHRHLARVMHLIPENVLVGGNDVIPGIADPPREKGQEPDGLRKPKQVKAMPSFIEKLNINLSPSLDKLEEELCRQLIDDRNKREGKEADGTTLSIMERRLQIGVHNGWLYVDKPEVIHLGGEAAGMKGSSLRRSMRGHQRTPSASSLSNIGSLAYKNRIQLDGMVEDPSLMVVFVLQYVLGEPVDKTDKTKRATKGNSTRYDVVVRWATWNPFTNVNKTSHTVSLQGGPASIPDSVFVFDAGDFSPSTASLKSAGGTGTLSFEFVNQRKGKPQSQVASTLGVPDIPALSLPPTARANSQTSLNENAALQESQIPGRPPIPSSDDSVFGKPPVPPSRPIPTADFDSVGYMTETSSHLTRSRNSAATVHLYQKGATPGMMSSGGMPMTPQSGSGMYPSPSQVYSHMPPQSPYGASGGAYGYQGSPYQGMGPFSAAPVYHPTPRGYIPVEITHVRDQMSPASTARSGAHPGDLYELPFTPVHAPIMATVPGRHSGQGLSRAAYARLYTAGFPPILDRNGEPPDVVDPADDVRFVMYKEETDKLQANEVTFQFLAYSKVPTYGGRQPGTVFFTFQFYRFPTVTTERLLLGTVEGDLSLDPTALPCLLQKLAKDGSVQDGPPGLQLKYDVDPAFMKPGEGRLFVEHLACQQLHIDIWDGDSLLLIGSTSVDLKHLCRQARESVQSTYELNVMATEYIESEVPVQAGDVTREGVVRPVDVRNILKGRLHLRLANVGHPSDGNESRTERGLISTRPKVVVTSEAGSGASYGGGSLLKPPSGDHASVLRKTKVAKAAHMAEVDHELASLLYTRKEKLVGEEQREARGETNKAQQRKLARMQAVRQTENESTQVISPHLLEKEERSRDLKTISMYRNHHKREGILNMLNSAITSDHIIAPSMGTTQFFEFVLRNPYNTEHTVIIDVDDPELIVVTDPREWRHFKTLHDIQTPVEEGMFNTDTQSSKPEVFLRPKECISIPFKYLTFKADHSTQQSQGPSNPFLSTPKTKTGSYYTKRNDPMEDRMIKVFFKTQENKPIAILSVRVEPQPHIIDQTFRFHHPEQTFLKKSIRLPPLHTMPGMPIGGGGVSQVFVRCSDPNVISESRQVQQGEPHDIFLKVPCGASPQIKRFHLAIYTDPFLSQPLQVWQVYVHALQRVDVAAIEGQTSRFTLVLRGTQASRLVQCFSSHQDEMQIEPRDPFMLTANTLQEIHAGVRPTVAGTKFLYINVVDVEYHQLIRTWLVCVTCRTPVISKAYELVLPIGGGKGSNKRIAYTNPYPMKKVFYLRTNRDDMVQFKETRLEIASGATESIGLRFAPSHSSGTAEILVFINDEEDKNEETFCVRATYQ